MYLYGSEDDIGEDKIKRGTCSNILNIKDDRVVFQNTVKEKLEELSNSLCINDENVQKEIKNLINSTKNKMKDIANIHKEHIDLIRFYLDYSYGDDNKKLTYLILNGLKRKIREIDNIQNELLKSLERNVQIYKESTLNKSFTHISEFMNLEKEKNKILDKTEKLYHMT